MKKRIARSMAFVLLFSAFFVPARAGADFQGVSIERLLESLTVEEKVGQLFMVGFPGTDLDDRTAARIVDLGIGSFIFFNKNSPGPAVVAGLTRAMQELAASTRTGIPLLLAMDQEQGRILRLEEGVTLFPGNYALGKIGDPWNARQTARITGEELKAVGIQINLGPVADVNSNPDNPVIGSRSFGESPELTATMVSQAAAGFAAAGVASTAKHFPGHGDVTVDSHFGLPVIDKTLEELRRVELPPFQAAIDQGVPAIMTAHILFPNLDPDYPATASPAILKGLLRDEMGFQGLVISDAIEMKALTDNYYLPDLAVRIINSGCDMIIFSENLTGDFTFEEIHAAVLGAAREGTISADRLDEAVRRVLTVKDGVQFTSVREEELPLYLRLPHNVEYSREIMTAALRTNHDAVYFPVSLEGKTLAVVSDVSRFYSILPDQDASRLYVTTSTPPADVAQACAGADEIWIFLSGATSRGIVSQAEFNDQAKIRFFSLNDPYLKGALSFRTDSYLNLFAYKIPLEPVADFLAGGREAVVILPWPTGEATGCFISSI
ncbi:MAG: glycoside hydrolase family 3 N-terminal domain-containing protein [Pseudomonadota bacterium]